MKEKYSQLVAAVCQELFSQKVDPKLTRPDEIHGDFATNVAMQLAGKLGKNPREVAEQIVARLAEQDIQAAVAGPGFINITVSNEMIWKSLHASLTISQKLKDQVIVTEYSDPNPFKVLHAGHLYTTLVGDAISNIIQTAGAEVHRTNFGGDVGLHVGRAMWGIIQTLGGEYPEKLAEIPEQERPEWVSARYVEGNTAYETDESAKEEIVAVNQRVYALHNENDHDSPFAQIYWTCRQWSYDGFDRLYKDLEVTPFEKYYPESATTPAGVRLVDEALKAGVLEDSDGAIVYKGEKDGLHTRVFQNSKGLPTYEAKDLGLVESKWQDYHFDRSVIITANDIVEYMKVVLKVMSHFQPDIEAKTTHLTHGLVKLPGGKKMSSRAGSVVLASDIIDAAYQASSNPDKKVVLGAVRYSFLKNRLGGDIIYDPEESVATEGNSGPYLQYALVRARSILRNADHIQPADEIVELDAPERSLARKITEYPEVFDTALNDYSPHHICSYLYELAQVFNRFYEQSRVIDDPREQIRKTLVVQYEATLAHGLGVLGMPTPEKM